MKVARRFFQDSEIVALNACATAQQRPRFYDYWTLKEARIKAAGEALGPALESCGFQLYLPSGVNEVGRITERSAHSTTAAYYCLLDPMPDYRLSACCLSRGDFRPDLRLLQPDGSWSATALAPQLRAVSRVTRG